MSENRETWTNPSKSLVYILVHDKNQNLVSKGVRPGHKVTLTTEERLANQDRAASPDRDLFTNGSLVPLRLLESAEDYHEIASNPNLMSESDMKELFSLKTAPFKARLDEIDNPIVLIRMMEIANAGEESGELNLTMTHFRHLERRLKQVQGTSDVIEVTQVAMPESAPKPGVMQSLSEF